MGMLKSIVDERRRLRNWTENRDMMDALLSVEDENGRKLDDEEIIDILVMYLNAGHESSGHIIMWTTVYLQKHPEIMQKAKVRTCTSISSSFECLLFLFESTTL